MCIFGLVAILTSTACIALRLLKLREHKILQIATIVGVFSAGKSIFWNLQTFHNAGPISFSNFFLTFVLILFFKVFYV